MSQRFRRLTDLFVDGKTVELPDGSHLWIQVINAYERDECISDGQVARARLVLALKDKGDERLKIEARLVERGRDLMVEDLAQGKTDDRYPEIVGDVEVDPDWADRVAILRRTDFSQAATVPSEDEKKTVDKILEDWTNEITRRLNDERAYQVRHYERVSDEELLDDYMEMWLDIRGREIASAEYALTELWYATRYCDAVRTSDGILDHSRCEGHPQRVFADKAEARACPDRLQQLLKKSIDELAMDGRDPKGSASPRNSSGSSPTPNAEAASTPSTSTEIPVAAPGT